MGTKAALTHLRSPPPPEREDHERPAADDRENALRLFDLVGVGLSGIGTNPKGATIGPNVPISWTIV